VFIGQGERVSGCPHLSLAYYRNSWLLKERDIKLLIDLKRH